METGKILVKGVGDRIKGVGDKRIKGVNELKGAVTNRSHSYFDSIRNPSQIETAIPLKYSLHLSRRIPTINQIIPACDKGRLI